MKWKPAPYESYYFIYIEDKDSFVCKSCLPRPDFNNTFRTKSLAQAALKKVKKVLKKARKA